MSKVLLFIQIIAYFFLFLWWLLELMWPLAYTLLLLCHLSLGMKLQSMSMHLELFILEPYLDLYVLFRNKIYYLSISLIIAIWPAFGFYSFLLVFSFFMGFLNVSHFLPNNHFGSLLLGGIFIGSFFSHMYIEHEGFLHYTYDNQELIN